MDGIQGLMPFLGQDDAAGAAAAGAGMLMTCICPLVALCAIPALMWWKVFEKAGVPGWMSIVPILNYCKLAEISGRPAWWGILLIVPIVQIVILILICIDLAKKFGKDTGYAIGMALLGIVFFPMLGFGDATYDKSRT